MTLKFPDMDDEMLSEAVDTAVTACDKFPENMEAAAQMLKVCIINHQ